MSKEHKKPPFDIGAMDQATAGIVNVLVPLYGGVFRAFCAEAAITREEALTLTCAYIAASLVGRRTAE